jgi:hypothetical protein
MYARELRRQSPMCKFEENGICYALCCYSDEECSAREEDGYPKYADTFEECVKRVREAHADAV